MAKDIAELKAVSQNPMHSNLSVTDGVYGILSDSHVRAKIAPMTKRNKAGQSEDIGTLLGLTKKVLERLEMESGSA